MNHYLVDTNVIIDMLLDRNDADAACAVVQGAERGEYALFLCALSYTNIYYALRKLLPHKARINALKKIKTVIETAPVNDTVIAKAINSDWKDFEDAVQNYSALDVKQITGIITRNAKDFERSSLKIINPRSLI